MTTTEILYLIGGIALGAMFVGLALWFDRRLRISAAQQKADEILLKAERESEGKKQQLLLDAREGALRERERINADLEKIRGELRDTERQLEKKESALENRTAQLDKRERTLESAQRKAADAAEQCDKRRQLLDRILHEQREMLLKITGLERAQAERLLLKRLESDFAEEIGARVQCFTQQLQQTCEERSRQILSVAIQRYASGHTADTTCAIVDLPNEEMKGRIIGRDGRNIRAFEKATGVDVVVDDTPGIVMVSCFDNVRREIARLCMQRLITDGRIHPARIEEVVAEVRDELDRHILETGTKAAQQCDVGPVPEKILGMIGKLKFRTSYSQNVLQHSIEVSHLTGMLADELGLDGKLARRCGLFHDIGKAVDHEIEGGHPKIGADIARRCGENETVLHAISGHHDDVRVDHLYTVLVAAADSISASRPGARRETLEKYVNRLKDLEAVACEFEEVESAYAIQAGREIRVIANAEKTTDNTAAKLSHDIAQMIQNRLSYPGEIKVTVIREVRAVEYAR